MAITIGNLTNKKGVNTYTFSDLHLDMEEQRISNNIRNSDSVTGSDIIIDTDEQAIKNSIINGMTQIRYTNPLFNVRLRKYIGQPISDMGARSLGDDINRWFELFEPRATVVKILVAPNYDIYSYQIVLVLFLNNLAKQVTLTGSLNDKGRFVLL